MTSRGSARGFFGSRRKVRRAFVTQVLEGSITQVPRRVVTQALGASRAAWFPPTICAALLGLVTAAAFVLLSGPFEPTYPNGDQAVLEIYTLHALNGKLLLGPYSQHLWHHPGPSYFYLLAPVYWLGGHTEISLYAAALALNLTAIACAVVIIATHHDRFAGVLAVAFAWLYVVRAGQFFVNPWNPHIVVLWLIVLVLLCALILRGQVSLLPAVIAMASFIVQTHVASGLVVVTLALIAVGKVVADRAHPHRMRAQRNGRALAIATAVLLAMWALPMAEQLTGRPGNLQLLYQFFLQRQDQPQIVDAWNAFARALAAPFQPGVAMAVEQPLLGGRRGASWTIAALQMLLLPVAAWVAAQRGATVAATTCVLAWLASLLGFLSVTRIQGAIEDHHVFWISTLGLLNVFCLLSTMLWPILSRHLTAESLKMWTRLSTAISVIAVGGLAIYGLLQVKSQYDRALRTGAVVRAFSYGVQQYLQNNGIRQPVIRVSRVAWPEAAGVVLQLYKRGVPVKVESHWTPILGDQLAATGSEDAEIVFADRPLAASMAGDGRYRRLARHADLFVFARRAAERSFDGVRHGPSFSNSAALRQ